LHFILRGRLSTMREHESSASASAALHRRAARYMKKRQPRKAAIALRHAVALDPRGATFVRLARALASAGKHDSALHALRQALYCFRHDELRGKARTVARLILALDPSYALALKRSA
jgi:Flp pilus assembly protein TadD